MTGESRESFVELLAKVGNVLDGRGGVRGLLSQGQEGLCQGHFFLFFHSVSVVVVSEDAAVEAAAAAVSGKGKKKKAATPVAGAIDWVTLRNVSRDYGARASCAC